MWSWTIFQPSAVRASTSENTPAASRAPVVMMSGYDQSEAAHRFASESPTGFLHKPFEIDDLLGVVDLMSKNSV